MTAWTVLSVARVVDEKGGLICDNASGPDGATNTRRGLTTKANLTEAGAPMADPQPNQKCAVDDCVRPRKGRRDWCAMHTERWRRWGDPTITRPRIRAVCTVEGCDRLNDARGLCIIHYCRARYIARPRRRAALIDRIGHRIDRSGGPDACWPWTGPLNPRGYGQTFVRMGDRNVRVGAHRAAYIAEYGDVPDGLFVLHNCDNPPCCNPAHLRTGTHRDNMADRQEHGAGYPTGEEHPRALSVSSEVIVAIRRMYRPGVKGRGQHAIAQQFGLSRTTVQRIVTESDRWAESA
jgi:hypothetical protein